MLRICFYIAFSVWCAGCAVTPKNIQDLSDVEYTALYDPLDHLIDLVEINELDLALKLVNQQGETIRKNKDIPSDIKGALIKENDQQFSTTTAPIIRKLQDTMNNGAPRSTWKELKQLLAQAEQLQIAYRKQVIRGFGLDLVESSGNYRAYYEFRGKLAQFREYLNTVNAQNAILNGTLINDEFKTIYPVTLTYEAIGNIFSAPKVMKHFNGVPSHDLKSLFDTSFGGNWKQVSDALSEPACEKYVDWYVSGALSKIQADSWEAFSALLSDDFALLNCGSDRALLTVFLSDRLDNQGFSFPVWADVKQPPALQSSLANIGPVLTINATDTNLVEKTINSWEEPAKYVVGYRNVLNPDYIRAKSNYDIAANQLARAQADAARYTYCALGDYACSTAKGYTLGALIGAKKNLANATSTLNRTTPQIRVKDTATYSRQYVEVEVSKHNIFNLHLIINGKAAAYNIESVDRGTFTLIPNLHTDDAGSKSGYDTMESYRLFKENPPNLELSSASNIRLMAIDSVPHDRREKYVTEIFSGPLNIESSGSQLQAIIQDSENNAFDGVVERSRSAAVKKRS